MRTLVTIRIECWKFYCNGLCSLQLTKHNFKGPLSFLSYRYYRHIKLEAFQKSTPIAADSKPIHTEGF